MKLSYNGNILRKPTSYPDKYSGALTLREKCPNTEFFLVRIFLYSGRKKYGPGKIPYLGTFHEV